MKVEFKLQLSQFYWEMDQGCVHLGIFNFTCNLGGIFNSKLNIRNILLYAQLDQTRHEIQPGIHLSQVVRDPGDATSTAQVCTLQRWDSLLKPNLSL